MLFRSSHAGREMLSSKVHPQYFTDSEMTKEAASDLSLSMSLLLGGYSAGRGYRAQRGHREGTERARREPGAGLGSRERAHLFFQDANNAISSQRQNPTTPQYRILLVCTYFFILYT